MKKLLYIFILATSTQFVHSQGLIFDSLEFNRQPELDIVRGGEIPDAYSLEKYLPFLYPQVGSTCVAMSFTLARTMMIANELNLTDPKKITTYSLSPYYIYYLSRDKNDYSCKAGLNPITVGNKIKMYGFAPLQTVEYPGYYPFSDKMLCPNNKDFFPPVLSEKYKVSKAFKVDEVYTIKNIDGIKYALSSNHPVILAMRVPKSFENLKSSVWKPSTLESRRASGGHAIVAIAYDDNFNGGSVKIANSWGEGWGNQGKAWIRYADLAYWLDGALMMEKSGNYGAGNDDIAMASFKAKTPHKLQKKVFKLDINSSKINFDNKKFLSAFGSEK